MKTLLWLDDDELLMDVGAPVFAHHGFEIRKATSPDQAMIVLESEHVDGALLDVQLGQGENGLDVLDLIRERFPYLKVVIFTGFPEYDEQFIAERLGAKYLIKVQKSIPLDLDQQRRFFFVLHQVFSRTQELDAIGARQIQAQLAHIQETLEGGLATLRREHAEHRQLMDTILERVQLGRVEQAKIEGMVDSIARLLQLLRSESILQNTTLMDRIDQANNSIESEIELHNKLELTLPIVPFLLAYKVELDGFIGARTSEALARAQQMLRALGA